MPSWQADDELRALIAGYQDDVLSGRRVVGRLERLAVERHVRDLDLAARGERPEWRFSDFHGLRPVRFGVRFCRHTKGRQWAKQRLRFDSRSAWEAWVLYVVFGWQQQHADGHWERRFNEAFLSMARKNAKTYLAALVALFMYTSTGEPAAEVYFGATQTEQAAIGWKQAVGILRLEPSLAKRLTGLRYGKKGPYVVNKLDDIEATFTALSRNDHDFDGFNPYLFVADEIHAWPDSGLYDVMRSGQGARQGPMRWMITTRGANPESFCGAHERAMIGVLEGTAVDDSAFAFICTMDEGDDWKDPHNWPKPNPNIGVTVTIDGLKKDLQSALADPGKIPELKRKRFNLWTVGNKSWLSLEAWDACRAVRDEASLLGTPTVVATDLSKSDDFTASCRVHRVGTKLVARWQFWIPEGVIDEKARRSRIPLRAWVEQGLVTATVGPVVDQDAVKEWLREQRSKYRVVEWPFDPAQSWKLIGELENEGFRGVLGFPQQWKDMHGATVAAEDAILKGVLEHDGNPVARWMFRNVVVRENATGLHRIDKAKSPDKVDGMTALVMAAARLAVVREGAKYFVSGSAS